MKQWLSWKPESEDFVVTWLSVAPPRFCIVVLNEVLMEQLPPPTIWLINTSGYRGAVNMLWIYWSNRKQHVHLFGVSFDLIWGAERSVNVLNALTAVWCCRCAAGRSLTSPPSCGGNDSKESRDTKTTMLKLLQISAASLWFGYSDQHISLHTVMVLCKNIVNICFNVSFPLQCKLMRLSRQREAKWHQSSAQYL